MSNDKLVNTVKEQMEIVREQSSCKVLQVSEEIIHHYDNNEYDIHGTVSCTDTDKKIVMDLHCNGEFNKRGSTWIGSDGSFNYSFEIPEQECYSPSVKFIKFY